MRPCGSARSSEPRPQSARPQFKRGLRFRTGDDLASAVAQNLWSAKAGSGIRDHRLKNDDAGRGTFQASAPRGPEPSGRVSDEEYSRMSQADRWAYARSHDQKQFYSGGNGGER